MSAAGYTHSETFASLKAVKEELDSNYTTFQLLSTLDHFIESAIDPITSSYPDLVDVYLAKVVAFQFKNPNVKCSRNDKANLPALLFNSVTLTGKRKREQQRKMLLNRGLLLGLISVFLKTVKTYRALHDHRTKLPRSQRQLLMRKAEARAGSQFLFPAIMEVEAWSKKAYHFKALIVQKYIRMSLMQAKRTYEDVNYGMSLNDIIQVYLIYLSKAIERCDSRQGVLTTYIQSWFYSARAEILKTVAKDSVVSSYDQLLKSGIDLAVDSPEQRLELLQHICEVAKRLDPGGAVRYTYQIPEQYGSQDLKKLRLHAATQTLDYQPQPH